ncbi:hypothetical protein SAMN05216228_10831 [Rhizobium tibeticum]|uniref:Uncharacterized protein n=1 Tax=Rhizobium tibeticum TaxID=501024 RepID=A0A1H8WWR5_9HYPH|nr:hypothetical protein RTCCBAU85039_6737 [Rhizobium tibeticum]SEP32031.1 hypothetical protein SAMN05216228_10831 [Rhizobium tibeticum]
MRHRRGIDLAPPADFAVNLERETLGSLPEMYVLVAAPLVSEERANRPMGTWPAVGEASAPCQFGKEIEMFRLREPCRQ